MVYWMELSRLADTHPTIHKDVTNVPGCWTYQRNNEFGLNGLAADQSIETTINKDILSIHSHPLN